MAENMRVVTVGEKKLENLVLEEELIQNGMINSKFIKKQLFQNIIIKS